MATGSGTRRTPLAERANDTYQTPPSAVHALLDATDIMGGMHRHHQVPLPHRIWEPACGPGSIVRVLRDRGHQVVASDLVDYDSPDQDHAGWDFLMERHAPASAPVIVTNPPFKLAADFVRHGLSLCPRVLMFLRLAFYESVGRSDIFDGPVRPAEILVMKRRVPMMHREGYEGKRLRNSGMPMAWFVWDRLHEGPTVARRIDG